MDHEPPTESVPRKAPWEIPVGRTASQGDQHSPFSMDANEHDTETFPQVIAEPTTTRMLLSKQFHWGKYFLSYFISLFLVLLIAGSLELQTTLQNAGGSSSHDSTSFSVPEVARAELGKEEDITQPARPNMTSQAKPPSSVKRDTPPYWYRLDFHELRDGGLPGDWQVENGVWVDWQAGIPALTIRAGSRNDGKLTIPTRPLTSDFFFEVQLAGTTSSETRFRWTGPDTSTTSEIRCIASRNLGWQVAYLKESVAKLRYLHYSADRGTWFYFQNVATGPKSGLYLMIDGIESTRVRLGDPMVGQYDSLEIGFSTFHTSRIQNLRWGWLGAKELTDIEADGFKKDATGRSFRVSNKDLSPFVARNAEALRLHTNISQSPPKVFQAELDLASPALSGVAIAFIGKQSTPTLAIQLDLLRANQVNAPMPGTIDLRNRHVSLPLPGPRRANVEIRDGQLRLAINDYHIYSVPIASAIRYQALEVDLFGSDLSAFIDRQIAP